MGRRKTMCRRNSGFAPHRRQGGFIQGAILFALVIIAVVVAAFSLANKDSNTNADAETARVAATLVLKTGSDIQSGVNRAVADGLPASDVQTNLVVQGTADDGKTDLFDTTLRNASRPQLPENGLADGSTAAQPFAAGAALADGVAAKLSKQALTGFGTTQQEVILEIPGFTKLVCQRINNLANGTGTTEDPKTALTDVEAPDGSTQASEGCFGPEAGPYTYFRVLLTDAEAAT